MLSSRGGNSIYWSVIAWSVVVVVVLVLVQAVAGNNSCVLPHCWPRYKYAHLSCSLSRSLSLSLSLSLLVSISLSLSCLISRHFVYHVVFSQGALVLRACIQD